MRHIKSLVRVILLLVLSSRSLANQVPSEGTGFCYWTSASASGRTYRSFLRFSGRTNTSLVLFHTTWTEGQKLENCVVTDQPNVTRSYLSECREKAMGSFSNAPDTQLNISQLFAPDSPCVSPFAERAPASGRERRDVRTEKPALRRYKRAWIFPGTLWCGMGNKASSYEELGVFEQTDTCCREHDHCQETISSFNLNYGLFNRNFFTVSNCACDRRFRQCLLGVNDTISNMVGYTYFNVLKVPCFVLKQRMQCIQMTWFGMCNITQVAPLAILRNATTYNSTHPFQDTEDLPTDAPSNQITPGVPGMTPTTPRVTVSMGSVGPNSGHEPRPRPLCRTQVNRPGKGRGQRRKACKEPASPSPSPRTAPTALLQTTSPDTPHPPNWNQSNELENILPAVIPLVPQGDPSNHLQPAQDTHHRDIRLPCSCYKDLDECAYKILPGEERFGLRNLNLRTLYHCNCTRSLARKLRRQQEPDVIQSLLLEFVSPSCFKMQRTKDCSTGKWCSAYYSEASPIMRALRRVGESRSQGILEVPSSKVKRQDSSRPKKRRTPVRLYRRCLRLVSAIPLSGGTWGPI